MCVCVGVFACVCVRAGGERKKREQEEKKDGGRA